MGGRMGLRNTREVWGWPARLLHWGMAVLIAGLIGLGLWMVNGLGTDWDGLMLRKDLTQWHKSFGFTVFALACLRLVWRAVNPTPAPPGGARAGEQAVARAAHLALYALMIAVPLSGWLMASASPYNDVGAYPERIANTVFGWFELPDPYPAGDRDLSELWGRVHFWAAMALAGLVALHALAALWHHAVRRDAVLLRMLRGRARR